MDQAETDRCRQIHVTEVSRDVEKTLGKDSKTETGMERNPGGKIRIMQ